MIKRKIGVKQVRIDEVNYADMHNDNSEPMDNGNNNHGVVDDEEIEMSTMERHRNQFRSFITKSKENDGLCRTIIYFGFFMCILGFGIIGIALLLERNTFQSTHVVTGPRGPMGYCNITHANQSFFIAGDTNMGSNLTVGSNLSVANNSLNIYSNNTCLVLDSDLPICIEHGLNINGGINTNSISPQTPGSNITLNGGLTTNYPAYFMNDAIIYDDLTIGGVTFHWNGSMLLLNGPTNIGHLVALPLALGSAGNIGTTTAFGSTCISIDATQCLLIGGATQFLTPIQGPLNVNGSTTISSALYIQNTNNGLKISNIAGVSTLELFTTGLNNPLSINSQTFTNITSPTLYLNGNNININGLISSVLKLSSQGLQLQCGSNTASLKYSDQSTCGCLALTSPTGLCLNVTGPSSQGISVTGSGNMTLSGSTMNINFINGAGIGTPVGIKGSLSVNGATTLNGNTVVQGNLAVSGSMSFTNITVMGTSYFGGPLTAMSGDNFMTGLTVAGLTSNVTVSKIHTIFEGLGATFQSNTIMNILSELAISTPANQLRCSNPIFTADTLSSPNEYPCVEECPDFERCSPLLSNLKIIGGIEVGSDTGYEDEGNATFGVVNGKRLSKFQVHAKNIVFQADSYTTFYGKVRYANMFTTEYDSISVSGCGSFDCLNVSNIANFDGPIASSHFDVTFDTLKITNSFIMEGLATITGDIDMNGTIRTGNEMHSCCSGLIDITTTGAPTSTGTDRLWLIVEMNNLIHQLLVSENSIIPFNLIQTPTSKLASSFDTTTSLFTAPADAMYSITVYLSIDPSQYFYGNTRGVTLYRTFSYPISSTTSFVPVNICSNYIGYTTQPSSFKITCTHNGYFKQGDAFYVTASYNYVGPMDIYGTMSVIGGIPTTRLEIYMF